MRLLVETQAPHRWARITGQGVVRRSGVAETLDQVPVKPRSDDVWAVIPGEDLISTTVSVPTRNRRKLMQAIPYALEDRLTEDIDDFHFVLLDWKPGHSAVVGALSRHKIVEYREMFAEKGWRLFGMVADYQLLPLHPQADVTIADHSNGRCSLLRSDRTGATLDSEMLPLWRESLAAEEVSIAVNQQSLARELLAMHGGEVREWDIGEDFVSWLAHRPRRMPLVNLLPAQGREDSSRSSLPGLRAAIAILAIAVVGKIGVDGYEYVELGREHERLTAEIAALFAQTFPEEQRIVNARSQFRQKLVELNRGNSAGEEFQSLLAVVAPALGGSQATLEELSFRENALEVVCAVRNFAELDTLQKRFSQPGVNVELVGSGSLESRVTGRFRLQRSDG